MTDVAAALIWSGNTCMICRRPLHKSRGGLWEFPGGKLEPGETKEEALVRECREELGITIAAGPVMMEVTHTYPDMTVHLMLLHAVIESGTPQLLEHMDLRWVSPSQLRAFDFCPADEVILQKLLSGTVQPWHK